MEGATTEAYAIEVFGTNADVARKWFVLGIVVGVGACLGIFGAQSLWGNQGAGVATAVILAPIIVLERWIYVRRKERTGAHS